MQTELMLILSATKSCLLLSLVWDRMSLFAYICTHSDLFTQHLPSQIKPHFVAVIPNFNDGLCTVKGEIKPDSQPKAS